MDAARVNAVFDSLLNPPTKDAAATLTADTGECVTLLATSEAVYRDAGGRISTLPSAPWAQLLEVWMNLFYGDLAAVRAAFPPIDPPPTPPTPLCTSCRTPTVLGFIPDFAHNSANRVLIWYDQAPEYGLIGNIKRPVAPGYNISAYRCPKCGKLELYALERE